MNRADLYSGYDWGDIAKKLTAFVIVYLNNFSKKRYTEWNLPKGYKAEDVAYRAITDVLSGKRNWDPKADPDLLKYLQYSVCRSILANLLSSADNKVLLQLVETEDPITEEGTGQYCAGAFINSGSNENSEAELNTKFLLTSLIKELKDKKLDKLILLAMLEGHPTRDIAQTFKISETDIGNAKKRIKRGAEKIGIRQMVNRVISRASILIGLIV